MAPHEDERGESLAPTREEDRTQNGDWSCDDCGLSFKTAQGLSGHQRLAHSAINRDELEQREFAVRELEESAARRQREIDETGPAAIGMAECRECGSWFRTAENLQRHRKSVHPIENAVSGEVGVTPERVTSVWIEACRKQDRHPSETPAEIVRRFWDRKDREILERLLARNAVFRFAEKGD